MEKIKNKLSVLWPGLTAAFGVCFMLLVYAPMELYITNKDDFWFSNAQIAGYSLAIFAVVFFLCMLAVAAAIKLSDKFFTVCVAAFFFVLIGAYIQGNFLVSGLPGMDGRQIDWNAYPAERMKSVAVWAVSAALTAVLLWKLGGNRFRTVAGFAGGAIGLMLLLSLAIMTATSGGRTREFLSPTDYRLLNMGAEDNLIIVHLDAADAGEFEHIIAEDSSYKEMFKDFTYFDNALGGYPYTKCSVPLILTGQWFECQEAFDDYVDRAFEESPLFNELEEQGYSLGFYNLNEIYLSREQYEGRYENLIFCEPAIGNSKEMAKMVLRMAMVKYAPWDLKGKGYNLQTKLQKFRSIKGTKEYAPYDWSNLVFRDKLTESGICVDGTKSFKYFVLEGAHNPYIYDKNLNVVSDATYHSSVEASMTISALLIDKLKEAGIYDNSVVVFMADHGYNPAFDKTNLHQHPLLLIKGKGESHAFTVDNRPVSYADMPEVFVKLINGSDSADCFDCREGDSRERRFLYHDWTDVNCFEEYIQYGRAEDMSTMRPTGKIFEN